jgi:hypothetical protein
MAGKGQIEPRWEKGESGNPNGRPKGAKNRSTIARLWLETTQKAKNPITGEEQILSQEDLGTLALVKKMREGDVAAYKALMDSGYGAPLQQIEQTIVEQPIFPDVSADDFDE